MYIYSIHSGEREFYTCLCKCVICVCSSETEENTVSLVRQAVLLKWIFKTARPSGQNRKAF